MTPQLRAVLVLVLLIAGATSGHAQATINGRVLDAEGKPVTGIEVLLHAITETSGSQIDTDTSRADGSFALQAASVDAKSVYFVAVTHNGQLFMGELLRPPFPTGQEYIVRVGVNPIDFGGGAPGPAMTPAAGEQGSSRTAGAVVIAVAALVIGGMLFVALRRRPPEHRRLLVELARLEDELAAGASDAIMQKRRTELRQRLTARDDV